MKRTANAEWHGDLKSGTGTISSASGVLSNTNYSFHTRFEDGLGTNPEELLAAAHAGCFTMALSAQLAGAGLTAEKLATTCTISLEKGADGFAITESHLDLASGESGSPWPACTPGRRPAADSPARRPIPFVPDWRGTAAKAFRSFGSRRCASALPPSLPAAAFGRGLPGWRAPTAAGPYSPPG